MKKSISIMLCLVMLVSVFGIMATAADAKDAMYVKTNGIVNDEITYTIYLKKNVSLTGAIVKIVYDPEVLEPVSGGEYITTDAYGDNVTNVPGIYVSGSVSGVNNAYSIGYVDISGYKTGSSDKGFMTVTFKVISEARPRTNVSFYCVQFESTDTALNIPKNDENPQLFHSHTAVTLGKIKLTSVYAVENGLRVNWEPTIGATEYEVFKIENGKSISLGKVPATQNYYDDTTAVVNAVTRYSVRAYNDDGIDAGYVGTILGVFVKAPDRVAVSIQPKAIKLGWTKVDGATNYRLYRREIKEDGSRGAWLFLATAAKTATTYFDSEALESGKHYEYTVRTYVSNRASAVCRFATIRYFEAPTVNAVSAVGGVSITWNAIDGAETYRIYRKYNGAKTWTYIATVDANTLKYMDTAATTGRNIDYAVRAFASNGSSTFVAKRCAYVETPIISAISNTTSGVNIKWNAITGATGYRVYRRGAGEKYWTYLGTVKTTYYNDKSVSSGNYYRYTVRTVFYSVFSGYDANGLYIKYLATPKLTKIANSSAGVTINWNAVKGVTGYRVYRRGAGQTTWTYLGTVKTTNFTDKSVVSGNYYRYTVRAASGSTFSGFDTNGLVIKHVK